MNLPRYVLASNNSRKLAELQQQLNQKFQLVSQASLGITEVAETGLTFVENAILKARHASSLSGLPAIADDSGLEVDYLNGAPGIYSARYAGNNASDEENNRKLLHALKAAPDTQRIARFQCIIVLMRHGTDPVPIICQGSWEGHILHEPAGSNGFGYDPVFYVPSHDCSAAQLPPEIKNTVSHRATATAALLSKIL